MLEAPQGHGEGAALPQDSPLSPWTCASLSPNSICVFPGNHCLAPGAFFVPKSNLISLAVI